MGLFRTGDTTNIIRLDETGSTNADALSLALEGADLPFWVTARLQTGGKGRAGRTWVSEPGNLFASVAFELKAELSVAPQLALVAGVSLFDAVRGVCGAELPLQLKWPNDLLSGEAKAAGVLIESTFDFRRARRIVVIGYGVNVVSRPKVGGRLVTSLASQGCHVSLEDVFAGLIGSFQTALRTWSEGEGFETLRQAWLARATPIGTQICVNTGKALEAGAFAGLDRDGALLLQDHTGHVRHFTFGDVALLGDVPSRVQLPSD